MVKPARVRRSISSKIFLILFSSVLILFLATIMILTFSLDKIALQETYFRLSNYITITGFEWRNGNMIVPDENDNGMHNFGIIQGRYENGNYIAAYNRYKSSILTLEEHFARPVLEQRLIKVLKLSV